MEPYHKCPRFDKCSVNVCLLDPMKNQRVRMPEDDVCTMEKEVRLRLGKDLPWLGLTASELAGKKRWESLSESEQKIIREKAKVAREYIKR